MDHSSGPHPDQRNAAYESIFGRPSASHHQYQNSPQSTSQNHFQPYRQQSVDYSGYYYQQQQYGPQYDVQAAYAQQAMAAQYNQQLEYAQATYRQSYYPPQQTYQAYSQGGYNHLAPPVQQQYARSTHSSSRSTGVIVPQPQEPPDPSLEPLTRAGMTPAQAYQAQVYQNNPAGQHTIASHEDLDPYPERTRPVSSSSQHGARAQHAPQLGFDPPYTRLDLDFLGEGTSNGNGNANGRFDSRNSPSAGSPFFFRLGDFLILPRSLIPSTLGKCTPT